MALTAARKTAETEGRIIVLEAASAIFAGALVVANASGKAAAATKAASLTALGRAENDVAAGEQVTIRRGTFLWDNSSSDAVTIALVGQSCYIEDDCTVCKTATGSSAAGKVLGLDGGQVIVETR